jgi:hypothetical protein
MIPGWYKAAGFNEVIPTPAHADDGEDIIAVSSGDCSVCTLGAIHRHRHVLPVASASSTALTSPRVLPVILRKIRPNSTGLTGVIPTLLAIHSSKIISHPVFLRCPLLGRGYDADG